METQPLHHHGNVSNYRTCVYWLSSSQVAGHTAAGNAVICPARATSMAEVPLFWTWRTNQVWCQLRLSATLLAESIDMRLIQACPIPFQFPFPCFHVFLLPSKRNQTCLTQHESSLDWLVSKLHSFSKHPVWISYPVIQLSQNRFLLGFFFVKHGGRWMIPVSDVNCKRNKTKFTSIRTEDNTIDQEIFSSNHQWDKPKN